MLSLVITILCSPNILVCPNIFWQVYASDHCYFVFWTGPRPTNLRDAERQPQVAPCTYGFMTSKPIDRAPPVDGLSHAASVTWPGETVWAEVVVVDKFLLAGRWSRAVGLCSRQFRSRRLTSAWAGGVRRVVYWPASVATTRYAVKERTRSTPEHLPRKADSSSQQPTWVNQYFNFDSVAWFLFILI